MRAMMKKRGISAVFVAVLLVTAALITGCPTPESSGGKEKEQLPEGMGAVKISFADTVEQSRSTIMPDSTPYLVTDFLGGFTLEFKPVGGGAGDTKIVEIASVAASYPAIPLAAGTYTLDVLAYLGPTAKEKPVAGFSKNNIVINVGQTETIAITLEALADGKGTGTFNWSITNSISVPAAISKATMTISKISPLTPQSPIDLKDDFQAPSSPPVVGHQDLSSGYYYVDFEIIVADKTNNFRHILHVYQNMTSAFTYEFKDDHFSIGSVGLTNITYTEPNDIPPILSVAVASDGNGKILSGDGSVEHPYLLSVDDDSTSSAINPNKIIVTVNNPAGTFTSVVGRFGTTTVAVDVSGNTFTLTGGTVPFTVRALPYQFIVTGTAAGKPYGAEIFIVVTAH